MVEPFDNIINQLKDSPYLDYARKNPWVTTSAVVAAATLAKTGGNLLNGLQTPQKPSSFASSLFTMFQKPEETSIGGKISEIAAPVAALAAMGGLGYYMSRQKNALDDIQNGTKKVAEVVAPVTSSPSFVNIPKYNFTLPKSMRDTIEKGVHATKQWGGFAKEATDKLWIPASVASAIATPFLPMPWKFLTMAPWAWNAYNATVVQESPIIIR